MSFIEKRGFSSYKIQKINVSTRNKTDPNASDLQYEVFLPESLANVICITLVDYSFPFYMFPSFQSTNDTLDFSLSNPNINSGIPGIFSVVFPHIYMEYKSVKQSASYVDILKTAINNAINNDPIWTGSTEISFLHGNNFETIFVIKSILFSSDSTTMTLLFSSGPNKHRSASTQMGFSPGIDVVSSNLLTMSQPLQIIQAPFQTDLAMNKFLDVFVEENGPDAIKRIFVNDSTYVTNYFSTENIQSLDVITNNPPRNIDKLRIKLVHDAFLESTMLFPHAMTFHIISLDNGVLPIPSYVKQRLSY